MAKCMSKNIRSLIHANVITAQVTNINYKLSDVCTSPYILSIKELRLKLHDTQPLKLPNSKQSQMVTRLCGSDLTYFDSSNPESQNEIQPESLPESAEQREDVVDKTGKEKAKDELEEHVEKKKKKSSLWDLWKRK